jgi:hypothetical protein
LSEPFSTLPVGHSLNGPPVEVAQHPGRCLFISDSRGPGGLIGDDQARHTVVALVQEVLRRLQVYDSEVVSGSGHDGAAVWVRGTQAAID